MTQASPHISVCICTYKRPYLLKRLLTEINNQKTDGQFTYSVVVVDNDSQQSARAIIDSIRGQTSLSFDYHTEPEQNISLARNMAVRHGQGDFIALIDDDELPIDNWLLNHYRFLCATRADGSLGPVLPHYEIEPPAWVIKGKFFDRPIHNSGQRLRWEETRSGNVLLKKDVINPNEIAFDPKFGSGGEDRDFFKRKIKQGRVFLWCAEAPVFENIPEVRWTKSFMLRRALLRGKKNVQAYTQSIRGIIKSLIAISVYTLALPIAFIFGYHIFLRTLIREFDHLGKIASLCGIDVTKERYII